jgi:hypothetical protein
LEQLNYTQTDRGIEDGKIYEKRLRNLQNLNTRSFRTEVPKTIDEEILLVWL